MRAPEVVPPTSIAFTPPFDPSAFARAWADVRIDRVELERAVAPATIARVHACVHLGTLLPVDVHVALAIEPENAREGEMPHRERMWTEHSFHNGSYLFEAHVADALLATARRVSVRAWPRERRVPDLARECVAPTTEVAPVAAPRAGIAPRHPERRDDPGPWPSRGRRRPARTREPP